MALFQQAVLKKYINDLNKENLYTAWLLFQAHFHNAAIQHNILHAKEEEYQEGFVRDLFVNILGYTLKPQPGYNLVMEQKSTSDATKSDGAILSAAGAVTGVIELKDTNTTDLDRVAKQAFGYKHQHKDCVYIITANFEKLRFYISDAIDFEEFDLFRLGKDRFAVLYCCLQQQALHNDVPLKMKQQSLAEEENITKKLYADYSRFKKQLFASITQKNPQYNQLELFKKTQKLLDRFLFILFAEDRLLLPPNSVREILQQWEQLKELDNYVPLYDRFKKYFGYLNTGYQGKQYEIFAYNGGLFAPDDLLDNITIDDELLYNSTKTLSNYDFESEVDVNILGHIFEHSLNEIEEVEKELTAAIQLKEAEAKGASAANVITAPASVESITSPVGGGREVAVSKRKKDGVFYTPRYITKYIVENTLGTLCSQQKEALQIVDADFAPQKRKANTKQLQQKLDEYRQWLLQLTICDPACGSGAFLNQALEFLIAEHKSIDELTGKLFGDAMVLSDVEASILENNLYGVDINDEATEIAKLSLWLRTARKGRKLNNLNQHIKCGNSLIDAPAVAGDKAFNWQEEFPQVFAKGGFDVVIGNPPYVLCQPSNTDSNLLTAYKKFNVASYKIDLFHLFFEKAITILKQNRKLGFITPNTYLTNKYVSSLRNYILSNSNIDQLIQCDKNVFVDASVDVALIILDKNKSVINEIFTGFMDVDGSILNHQFILTEDWNIAPDYIFNLAVKKLDKFKDCELLGEIAVSYFGIQAYDRNSSISIDKQNRDYLPIIDGADIKAFSYSIPKKYFNFIESNIKSGGDWSVYSRERIVVRQIGKTPEVGYSESHILASNTMYSIYSKSNEFLLKYIFCILNSSLIKQFWLEHYSDNKQLFPKIKGYQLKNIPIKKLSPDQQIPFVQIADIMLSKNKELQQIKQQLLQLLQGKYPQLVLTKKLQDWPGISFNDFLKELDKQKIKLTLPEQAEWMQYVAAEKAKANAIQQLITQTDKAIDAMVYALYQLTPEEIQIVEGNA